MKMKWMLALMCAALMVVAAGCGKDAAPQSDKLRVVATVFPVADVVKKVGGDLVDVHLLVPPGAEPHDWEPTVSDRKEIGKAKVFFYNGAGLEPMDQLLTPEVLGDATPVELTQGLTLRVPTAAEQHDEDDHDHDGDHHEEADHHEDAAHHHDDADVHHDDHDHDHEGTVEHEHEHEHEHEGHYHHHHHGGTDPHVWLDPHNVMFEVDTVVAALTAADPAHADTYKANGEAYKKELAKLDAEFADVLAQRDSRQLVVTHAAFGYLADRYGLEQIAIMGIDADAEPTPERMARLIETVREHDIRVIYTEELISPKLAEAIARETGAQVCMLNPIEGLTAEQEQAGADYLSLQRENLAALKAQ